MKEEQIQREGILGRFSFPMTADCWTWWFFCGEGGGWVEGEWGREWAGQEAECTERFLVILSGEKRKAGQT